MIFLPGRLAREPAAVREKPAERKAAWTAKATGSWEDEGDGGDRNRGRAARITPKTAPSVAAMRARRVAGGASSSLSNLGEKQEEKLRLLQRGCQAMPKQTEARQITEANGGSANHRSKRSFLLSKWEYFLHKRSHFIE